MANQFGKTWWGEQWLNALSHIDFSNRLPRGRSYANKGAVLNISVIQNKISAKVSGSRPKPYQIEIIIPAFKEPGLTKFVNEISLYPVIVSKLLNRQLDPKVLTIAEEAGLKVFPTSWSDLQMKCSCPDWAVPCKHLAAVIYKLSLEIDNNPFLVFELHKLDLIGKMKQKGVVITLKSNEIPWLNDLYSETKKKNTKTFQTDQAYRKLAFHELQSISEPLISLLADHPAFYQGGGNFKEKYKSHLTKAIKLGGKIADAQLNLNAIIQLPGNELPELLPKVQIQFIVDTNHQAKVSIDKKLYSIAGFIHQLSQIEPFNLQNYHASTASIYAILQLAIHLLATGSVVPQIVRTKNSEYTIRWQPALLSSQVKILTEQIEEMLPPGILIQKENKTLKAITKNPSRQVLSWFLSELIKQLSGVVADDLFLDIFFNSKEYAFNKPGEEALGGGIMAWLQKYFISQSEFNPQIIIEEHTNGEFKLNINIIQNKIKRSIPISLRQVMKEKKFDQQRYEILQSLTQLSSFIPFLEICIHSNGEEIILSNTDFTHFLLEMIPALQLLDVSILLPKSLQEILKPKVSIKISKSKDVSSFLRLDQLLRFNWQIAIGNEMMNEDEFKELLKTSDGLIRYKSRYFYADPGELQKLSKHFLEKKAIGSFELFRAALSQEYHGANVSLTDEVKKMIKESMEFNDVVLPTQIQAVLRAYQHRGYSWMYHNTRIGFGSLLADDMGLGKTLQVISLLLKFKEEGQLHETKALVIVPTGLLTNWQAEIEKFAPALKTVYYHGSERRIHVNSQMDVCLTTYGMVRSDIEQFKKIKWKLLVIDEAQNIKNISTAQTKAVKALHANHFIAMSGTPVENRLSEFWSIMDFCNRGFLGNMKEFADNYSKPIQQYNDARKAELLKKATAPFLMRRLKSDKSIIADLPDKIEMDCFANLSKDQAGLYEKILAEALREIEGIKNTDRQSLFKRQGLVLQMILALKQICNHPTQYLKNKNMDPLISGKTILLFDKLDSIIQSNEKVLLFTQFAEMGKLLCSFINQNFGEEPLFYHGAVNIQNRKLMVDQFQNNTSDKIFILSLKAGGTGLNLTKANHVIHYDLWWNPAVEAQATDRAYRIGQKSNVMVHRFITKNTFEERINEMIQSKKALAQMTISTGENWIGNLSNEDLRAIFQLK